MDSPKTGRFFPRSSRIVPLLFCMVVSLHLFLVSCGTGSAAATASGGGNTFSVLTYHNDVARTGQDLQETILTPANVNSASFGKVGFLPTTSTGAVYAQPLYVPNLMVNGAAHNVVFVATEDDIVYAFDADNDSLLWQTSLLPAGETPSDDRGCSDLTPEIGITSTPVIDPAAGPHGSIFALAISKDSGGNYHQRLHALDLSTGAEQADSPTLIQATYPSSSGTITFDPAQEGQRDALLLLNGVIYIGWASHCDDTPYSGWIMGYKESTLQQSTVLNITPNGTQGGIWMSGGGMAADSAGNIYLLSANGTFDTTLNGSGFPQDGDYGNAFLKLSTSGGTLSVADYFTMKDTVSESNGDLDFGAGGPLLLPDLRTSSGATVHLAVGAGKDFNLYVVNRDSLGKFSPTSNNDYQEIDSAFQGGIYSTPAYFNNTVYCFSEVDHPKAFSIQNGMLSTTPSATSSTWFNFPGATPSISANGSSDGIVWAVQEIPSKGAGILHAFDAGNLATELYNSDQAAGGRDQFSFVKFTPPTIANGKVYVATPTGVMVFGLLP